MTGRTVGSDVAKALTIATTTTRRMMRDPSAWFFLLVFPLLLVLVLGSVFGSGAEPPVGVARPDDDLLAGEIREELEGADVELERYGSEASLRGAVERGDIVAGVVIPDDLTDNLRDGGSDQVQVYTGPDATADLLFPVVEAAVAPAAARAQAALFAETHVDGAPADLEGGLADAAAAQENLGALSVRTTTVGDELFPSTMGQFDLSASSQLVLFVFINGLTASLGLIQSRQLGVTRRMTSTPTPHRVLIAGELLSRLSVTLFQGLYIMSVTWLLFGVDWGEPLAAVTLMSVFALVPASIGLLLGATLTNDQQAMGISVILGLGLAAVGGSMVPIELFSPAMERIARFTPHAWANAGFAELVRQDGGVLDILPELGVLAGMAAALLVLATWRLRKVLAAG